MNAAARHGNAAAIFKLAGRVVTRLGYHGASVSLSMSIDVLARVSARPGGSFSWGRRVCPWLIALVALDAGCRREQSKIPAVAAFLDSEPAGWLKGQTHVHSGNSSDSNTPPADVVRYYAEHGYDFIVFTDHNRVTRMPSAGSMQVIAGAELTQNLPVCDPPAAGVQGCNLHMNALFAGPDAPRVISFPVVGSLARIDVYQRALDVTRASFALAQLNHPNFRWGADAEIVTELARRGVKLMEIANGSGDCDDAGDANHPSTEALWDHALTAGQTLYGVATDDAHHYYDADAVRSRGEPTYEGNRGWVMVRAARNPQAIVAALQAGDFYASTGVRLRNVETSTAAMEIDVAPETPGDCDFVFIGSGGRELARTRGRTAKLSFSGLASDYVRAVVMDGSGHKAWLQPIRIRRDSGAAGNAASTTRAP